MTQFSVEVDPFIAERIAAIRDRFGLGGLRAAIDMATAEIAIFEDEAGRITDDDGTTVQG
jgi:hypothetical protein